MRSKLLKAAIRAFVGCLAAAPAWAHDGPHADSGKAPAPVAAAVTPKADRELERARKYFSDTELLTHEGKRVRFFTDVLKDRIVVVTFFYSTCTGACPITNQKLSLVQDMLGDRFGKDIFFVSISTDPEKDTSKILETYRKNFTTRDGWVFLTGEPEKVKRVSRRLGQTYDKEAHLPLLLAGNVRTAHWMKLRPNLPNEAIATQLRMLADESTRK
jgi:cytochrome oxidase Cu insertion factor (SCO1/SenC/PrrC family)